MTTAEKIAGMVAAALVAIPALAPRRQTAAILQAQSRTVGAALATAAGRPVPAPPARPTSYDRHRAEYIRTGDQRALQRMLRAVRPERRP